MQPLRTDRLDQVIQRGKIECIDRVFIVCGDEDQRPARGSSERSACASSMPSMPGISMSISSRSGWSLRQRSITRSARDSQATTRTARFGTEEIHHAFDRRRFIVDDHHAMWGSLVHSPPKRWSIQRSIATISSGCTPCCIIQACHCTSTPAAARAVCGMSSQGHRNDRIDAAVAHEDRGGPTGLGRPGIQGVGLEQVAGQRDDARQRVRAGPDRSAAQSHRPAKSRRGSARDAGIPRSGRSASISCWTCRDRRRRCPRCPGRGRCRSPRCRTRRASPCRR
jgi:hypothetical protein